MVAQSIPAQQLIERLDRRSHAQRKLAQNLRRLSDFDEELMADIVAFCKANGIPIEIERRIARRIDD